jgi:hypothetical protein
LDVEKKSKITNLRFIHIIRNVRLVLVLRDISPPSGHQFHIFEVPFFAFELEVSIDGDEESI